jgi:hypothetical protein
MFDFWAILAASIAAVLNFIIAVRNQIQIMNVLRTLDQMRIDVESRIIAEGGMTMPPGDRIKRRLVEWGQTFDSDELRDGLVELKSVPPNPSPPPEDEQAEPWGLGDDADPPKRERFGHRLRAYRREHKEHDGD